MGLQEADLREYRPGDRVALHLRVEALLGEGGAGAVYRVRDERTGKRIALKQLRAAHNEHKALLTSQFAREFHTLSELAHPRIIEVYDYGVDRDCPYYTMELLDGEDLHDRGKLPFREACALLCDVASSLAILHSRGLIHRDVSARNVRCTGDGRAKLIDFGAMVSAGGSHRPVGTPPFVPPEVLQMQALDARADLYGLGALAYWTLAGKHAYPAHTFNQLRDAWRRSPRKLSDFDPEIPAALAELVMSLLRLDRDERPRTASEVMARLSGIAGLPIQELPQVSRAYLITPTLIGRSDALGRVRAALLRTVQTGRGGTLLIEGAAGVGRSRMLDACVLEAKLMGLTVLRATAADASTGDYGAARALLSQLVEAFPDLVEQTAHPRASLLVHILPSIAPHVVPAAKPERRHIQAALRDFFLSIARGTHLVLAVDDMGMLDEPSSALLGVLAHGAKRRRLNLVVAAMTEVQTPALAVLREIAERIELSPLDAQQTEALLRGLFGDSVQASALAARLHPLSQGRPRELMTLAEHLVDRGLARYEAGSWTLPREVSEQDLPRSDRAVAAQRIAALGNDARELAEALSLTDVRALSLAHFSELTLHHDSRRTFHALDELLRAGVLVPEADRYRLSASDVLAPLAETLSQERVRALHGLIADALPRDRKSALRLLHLLKGGREQEAIVELLASEADQIYPGRLEALALAAERAEHLKLPLLTQLELQYRIARLAPLTGHPELFERFAWPLIARFDRDSGLWDYNELDRSLGESERIKLSIAHATARYEALPLEQRGFSPQESMLRRVAMHGSGLAMGGAALDLHFLARLGSIEPWARISTGIRIIQMSTEATREGLSGRYATATALCAEILDLLRDPKALPAETAKTTRLAYVRSLAIFAAIMADPSYEKWVAELDREPGSRGNAWRIRMIYGLAGGDSAHAAEYERRAELLDLQDSGEVTAPGFTARAALMGCGMIDDLNGVKRALEQITPFARMYPRWRVPLHIARAECKRLQGDLQGALPEIDAALALSSAGLDPDWSYARVVKLRTLLALGRAQEASELGLQYLKECSLAAVTGEYLLKGVTAEALAAIGQLGDAERLAEDSIAGQHANRDAGVRLGLAYDARARVAIAMRDAATFEICRQRCEKLLLSGRSPHLRARYERLLHAAVEAGIIAARPSAEIADEGVQPRDDDAHTVYSRMLTCISPVERAERALQLLLEATGARIGYFFGLRSGRLTLLFSPEPPPVPQALASLLEDCLGSELRSVRPVSTDAGAGTRPAPFVAPLARFVDDFGREFEPLVLAGTHGGEPMIAGVAALHYAEGERSPPRKAMVEAVFEALVTDDVVDPITCVT